MRKKKESDFLFVKRQREEIDETNWVNEKKVVRVWIR